MNIHPTAIVSKKAQLSKDVEIGPYAIIEDEVKIGQRVKIYAYAHILNQTTIGNDCQIHIGTILGHLPQMRKRLDTLGKLVIGERNIFREYSTVHRSTQKDGTTSIGDDNYFMAFSHLAHDCCIKNQVTICNGALIAGHVLIEDYAFISGNVTVHQFCRIGKYAMIGGLARVAKDVPPYMIVKGDSYVWAVNTVGLKRAGLSAQVRMQIKKAFKTLYKSGLNVAQALEELKREDACSEIEHLINFILHSQRGICGHKSFNLWQNLRYNTTLTKLYQIPAYQLFLRSRRGKEYSACTNN